METARTYYVKNADLLDHKQIRNFVGSFNMAVFPAVNYDEIYIKIYNDINYHQAQMLDFYISNFEYTGPKYDD